MDRRLAHVLAWFVWWALLFWLWMLLVGEWNRIEFAWGASTAAVAATLGEFARARAHVRARVPLTWIARAWSMPLIVFADFGILVWLLVRSALRREIARGYFRSESFPAGGDDPVSAGTRAWATVVATYSPNAYVVDIELERQLVLFHEVAPWSQSRSPAG